MSIDYGRMLKRAGSILIQNPALFVLGWLLAFATAGPILSLGTRLDLKGAVPGTVATPALAMLLGGLQLAGLLLLLSFFLSFIAAWAEAGLLIATDESERTEGHLSLRGILRQGRQQILPVWTFNVVYSVLVIIVAFIASLVFAPLLGATAIVGSGVGALTLALLAVALQVGAYAVRELGLRARVLDHHDLGTAFSTGWELVQLKWLPVIITLVVILAVGVIKTVITLPFQVGLAALIPDLRLLDANGGSVLTYLLTGLLVSAALAVVAAPFITFAAVFWTLFYRALIQVRSQTPRSATLIPAERRALSQDRELVAGAPMPALVATACQSPTAAPGAVVLLNYTLYSPATARYGLRAMLTRAGAEAVFTDPAHDLVVDVPLGTLTTARPFTVPADAPAGVYDVTWELWSADFADRYVSRSQAAALTVHQPEAPPEAVGLVPAPAV